MNTFYMKFKIVPLYNAINCNDWKYVAFETINYKLNVYTYFIRDYLSSCLERSIRSLKINRLYFTVYRKTEKSNAAKCDFQILIVEMATNVM